MTSIAKITSALVLFAGGFIATQLQAGEFVVSPIRLDLNTHSRSGVISVRNEGKEKLNFQLQATEWTQDAHGADQYDDTRDLVFFPKIMSVEPGEEGVVRVGARNLAVPTEKTYRLFIEELPGPAPADGDGKSARINVLIRFGAPIFVAPIKPEDRLDVGNLEVSQGVLTLTVKNSGNRHQRVEGIQLTGTDLQGKEVYALTLADRYLLAGTTKSYTTAIPADQCAKIAGLTVELKTDKAGAGRQMPITRSMCR